MERCLDAPRIAADGVQLICAAKIGIFRETAKSGFTSLNAGFETPRIAKSPLTVDWLPESEHRWREAASVTDNPSLPRIETKVQRLQITTLAKPH